MADDFLNKPFGMNIKVPVKTIKQIEKTAQQHTGNIFEPLFNFINENQDVFTGSVANQIEQFNIMSFNIGSELRKGKTNGRFDVKG